MLLPHHHYLFCGRSINQRLRLPCDNIQCCLRSVFKVCHVLQHQEAWYQEDAQKFFPSIPDSSYTTSITPIDTSMALT
jgi:hypothetical protein